MQSEKASFHRPWSMPYAAWKQDQAGTADADIWSSPGQKWDQRRNNISSLSVEFCLDLVFRR